MKGGESGVIEKLLADESAKGITVHPPGEAEQRAWRAVGEAPTEQIMATLPPEAAVLRDQLRKAALSALK